MYAIIENEKVAELIDDAANFLRETPKDYDNVSKKS